MPDAGVGPGSDGQLTALRDRLIAFLGEQDVMPETGVLDDETSLIRSGLLDSLALFNLTLWVEREAGRPFDVTALDLSRDWDTVAGIVAFVAALQANRAAHPKAAGPFPGSDSPWPAKS
jgi:acyl carrier protein